MSHDHCMVHLKSLRYFYHLYFKITILRKLLLEIVVEIIFFEQINNYRFNKAE